MDGMGKTWLVVRGAKCMLAIIRMESWRIARCGVIKLWRVTEELTFGEIWQKTRENVEKLFAAAKIMENTN